MNQLALITVAIIITIIIHITIIITAILPQKTISFQWEMSNEVKLCHSPW